MVNFALCVASLSLGKPINDMFGYDLCPTFFVIQATHNAIYGFGGCGMALFRLVCIHNKYLFMDLVKCNRLMKLIIFGEIIFCGLMVTTGMRYFFNL